MVMAIVLAVGAGLVLMGLAGVFPLVAGLLAFAGCVVLMVVLDIQRLGWIDHEFRSLVRRPTWADATGGLLGVAHRGELWVFPGEGRFSARFQARPSRVLVAFDEEAFVALDCGLALGRIQRRVVTRGEPVEFAVEVRSTGGCVLLDRVSGLRVRLIAGSSGPVTDHAADYGGPETIVDRLTRALTSTGWA